MARGMSKDRAREIADRYMPDEVAGAAKTKAKTKSSAPKKAVAPEPAPPSPAAEPIKKPRPLTPKEFRFCEEYIVDLNGTQAAIRAGYSEKTAGQIAYENLKKPEIQSVIADLSKARSARTQWDADKMLMRLGNLLEADIAEIYDDAGGLRPIHQWPLVFRQGLIAGIEVEELFEGRGDDREHIGRVRKIKIADRSKILEMIGKHVKVQAFKEKVEHDVTDPVRLLYAQIVGTGIRPLTADQAPGILPAADVAPPAPRPNTPNAIRPMDPGASEET